MSRILKIIFCAIIVDFFYFSSVFTFTGGYNSKLILGVFGLIVFLYKGIQAREMKVSREMIMLTILAIGVSLASLISMVYNNTGDDAYLSYVISMLVWLAAAYMVIVILNASFGKISIELIADYIIAISVFQCIIALLGNLYVPVNNFIKLLFPGTAWIDSVDRMYGIGDTTALDTGGIRYSIACIFSAFMLVEKAQKGEKGVTWYIIAFVLVTIIGNMIARTTTIGSVIGLSYLAYFFAPKISISKSKLKVFGWVFSIVIIMIVTSVWLYNTNNIIHNNLRFAFEGFFSLVEKGEWQVNSNNKLLSMYIFPESLKTWVIGDGYFNNPSNNPNYLGKITEGFYMNTDVGYLRFIYYFGLFGLLIFSALIIYSGRICCMRFPDKKILFLSFILLNFIIWLKVSTDCFFIFAIFIAMSYVIERGPNYNDTLFER